MKEIVATVTSKGQVTIPLEVRRRLGIKPRGKVAFVMEDDEVRLAPATATLEAAYGAVEPLQRPEDFEEITRRTREEKAQRTASELRGA